MIESRKAKMITNKSGSGSSTFRATLPTTWVRQMGLSEDVRDIKLKFDGEQIIIKNNKEEIKMLEKLLKEALVEVDREINRVGYIDDSDNCERFLDDLSRKLTERELVSDKNDLDLYYEKEEEMEKLSEELLEMIKDNIANKYNSEGDADEKGDYSGCYYKDEQGLRAWKEF